MSRIIISYRRADSAAISGRIFDRLASHYGDDAVFMDIDKIPFGTDFRDHIRKVLAGGDILLAVIGPSWLGKAADGTSRIMDEADPVCVEIESALQQKIRIIPVLADGATMPSVADLPEGLRDIAYLNAAPLDVGRDFRAHMDRLIRSIDEVLGPRRPALAQAGKRRSGARIALITVLSTFAIVLGGAAVYLLRGPSSEVRTQTEQSPTTYRVQLKDPNDGQNLYIAPNMHSNVVTRIPADATGITLGTCAHYSYRFRLGTQVWCDAKWNIHSGYISNCCIVDEKTGAGPGVIKRVTGAASGRNKE